MKLAGASVERRSSCADHPTSPPCARCTLCSRALCDLCFEFTTGGRPTCLRCAYEAGTRRERRITMPIAVVGLGVGALYFAWQRQLLHELTHVGLLAVGVVLIAAAVAYFIGGSLEVVRRDREAEASIVEVPAPHPFRQRARNVAVRLAPRVSGTLTALAVAVPFVVAAILFPKLMKLQAWVEAEVVLAVWWLVFASVLAVLLYRGYRLKDDYLFVEPWKRFGGSSGGRGKTGSGISRGCESLSGCDGCGGGLDSEGVLVVVLAAVAVAVLLGGAWVLAELALPIVLFAGYATITRALTRVAHDRHGCKGDLLKAGAWGGLWSALYLAPFSLLVALLHFALR